jgi:hypothetical protein
MRPTSGLNFRIGDRRMKWKMTLMSSPDDFFEVYKLQASSFSLSPKFNLQVASAIKTGFKEFGSAVFVAQTQGLNSCPCRRLFELADWS